MTGAPVQSQLLSTVAVISQSSNTMNSSGHAWVRNRSNPAADDELLHDESEMNESEFDFLVCMQILKFGRGRIRFCMLTIQIRVCMHVRAAAHARPRD